MQHGTAFVGIENGVIRILEEGMKAITHETH